MDTETRPVTALISVDTVWTFSTRGELVVSVPELSGLIESPRPGVELGPQHRPSADAASDRS